MENSLIMQTFKRFTCFPHLSLLVLSLLFTTFAFSQEGWENRITDGYEPALKPFYHGVASGDPTQSSVIIWTRVTPDSPLTIPVRWFVSTSPNPADFAQNLVAQGIDTTDVTKDYTLNVTVDGLAEDQWYYYVFYALGKYSVIGRTKTSSFNADHLRFGVVSCSNYAEGYFNAYRELTNRNDVEAIFHLGDYVYEYADGEFGSFRDLAPPYEIITLDNYRSRYSYYRLDPDLRDLHQQYPFITVWDDHETTNNSWEGGAQNHNPDNLYKEDYDSLAVEGDWYVRKGNGKQAYKEWMPVTSVEPIYRKFTYGGLADIFFLDTRLEGREEPFAFVSPDDQMNDYPDRTLLGTDQYNWLTGELSSSPATWKILGQQIMMAPLTLANSPLNMDQWDGYIPERNKLYEHLQNDSIDNMVVLTGDIHSSWANELRDVNFDENDPCGSGVGTEYVVTSVTSPGFPFLTGAFIEPLLLAANPHMKYIELEDHGFMIFDILPSKVQADWYYLSTLEDRNFNIKSVKSYYTNINETCVNESPNSAPITTMNPATTPTLPPDSIPDLEVPVAIDFIANTSSLGMPEFVPNPAVDFTKICFQSKQAEAVIIHVLDGHGKMWRTFKTTIQKGANQIQVDLKGLPAGVYMVGMQNARTGERISGAVIKMAD